MKILYIPVIKSVFDLPWALQKMSHAVTIYDGSFDPLNQNVKDNVALSDYLAEHSFDALFSYEFIPAVSDVCFTRQIPYLSWTYDSPLTTLFTESIYHPTNYTFIFDKMQCRRLWECNVPNVCHMPLATNIDRTSALEITAEDERTYSHDISFIGQLYENNIYNQLISFLPQDIQLELKLYLMRNLCNWSSVRPWPEVSDGCRSYLKQHFFDDSLDYLSLMKDSAFFGCLLLSRKLAEMERITILNALANRYTVDLYTSSKSEFLQNVHVHSRADYYTDANKVFYLSKINLNITLPSIETGIPQRIFDIMGCGGFVLTNYQEEIEDLFVPGKEIETFRTIDELYEKAEYYLTHEKERLTIAMNGWQKVRHAYNYETQVQKMLSIALKGE